MSDKSPLGFASLVACGAAFIWLTSRSLPNVVASHFGSDGSANGFMLRGVYVGSMLMFAIGLPALLVGVSHFAMRRGARINLPNRDYWLAPERRDETVAYLREHTRRFGIVLTVFLCYVHWLVVRANRIQPPHLSSSAIIGGLAVFTVLAIVWTRVLLRRFGSRP